MRMRTRTGSMLTAVLACGVCALLVTPGAAMAALRVCADPGNLPLSNNRGEGFENKIAAVLAKAMDTTVENYFRPGIERGLTRSTLDADQCDVMLDMPLGADDVQTTVALYRTTYVLAYRSDRAYDFKSLDDPRLKKLKVGVYETSGIREALAYHDVRNVADPLSQSRRGSGAGAPAELPGAAGDRRQARRGRRLGAARRLLQGDEAGADHHPARQSHGRLGDARVRHGDRRAPQRQGAARRASRRRCTQQKDAIRAILTEYGVPLVACDTCIISGDLPAHGPYKPPPRQQPRAAHAAGDDRAAQ